MWQEIKNIYHLFRACCANILFRYPWKGMKIIGVTGTDGKTTTASLIYHILDSAGKKAALVTSISAVINKKKYNIGFHVTTPRIFALRSYIKKARALGTEYFVLEVTSHALDQHRVFGMRYDVGVLTNITHEHLDYHKTYKNYVKTKAKLLKASKIAIVNKDDESYKLISKFKFLEAKLKTYGMKNNADLNTENFCFKTKLIGDFNKYNILAAASACKELGIKDSEIKKGIMTFSPPKGRVDLTYDGDFKIMIDFAHTPNSFDQLLKALRPKAKGRLIHVFGAAGLRDFEKRPAMGKNSSLYADIIILTSEDPRSEVVNKINKQIISGITNKEVKLMEVVNRKEAIEKAIKLARKGDFVVITGKAHEKSMNYGHGEVPWDEYEVVKNALRLKIN